MSKFSFPFHPWRLVLVIFGWNVLFAIDNHLYGVPSFGPYVTLAVGVLAVLCFTAPIQKLPGSWLLRDQQFALRWRWLFWYVGLIMAFFFSLYLYRLITSGQAGVPSN